MYVYILKCTGGSLYTGITSDMEKRIKQHLGIIRGGAKYTRAHPVEKIEVLFETESDTAARKLEYAVKQLPRFVKEKVINDPCNITEVYLKDLNEYKYIPVDFEKYNHIIDELKINM